MNQRVVFVYFFSRFGGGYIYNIKASETVKYRFNRLQLYRNTNIYNVNHLLLLRPKNCECVFPIPQYCYALDFNIVRCIVIIRAAYIIIGYCFTIIIIIYYA